MFVDLFFEFCVFVFFSVLYTLKEDIVTFADLCTYLSLAPKKLVKPRVFVLVVQISGLPSSITVWN